MITVQQLLDEIKDQRVNIDRKIFPLLNRLLNERSHCLSIVSGDVRNDQVGVEIVRMP